MATTQAEIRIALAAEFDQFKRELRTARGAADTEAARIRQSLSSIGNITAGVISVAGIKEATTAIIDSRAEYDRLRSSLAQGVGADRLGEELKFVSDTADQLGLVFSSTASAYAKFAAATRGTALEGEQTRRVFLAIAQAGTVLGMSADQMEGALLAVQQMVSKGKVSAEELRGQLGERLPGAFQVAARAMGLTTAELDKMLASGDLLADDFLPKFAAQLQGEFAAGLERAAGSTQAAVNRMTTAWQKLKTEIAGGVVGDATIAGLEFLRKGFEQSRESISRTSQDLEAMGLAGANAIGMMTQAQLEAHRVILGTMRGEVVGEARVARTDTQAQLRAQVDVRAELAKVNAKDRANEAAAARQAQRDWEKLSEKYRTASEKQADLAKEIRKTGFEAGKSKAEIDKLIAAAAGKNKGTTQVEDEIRRLQDQRNKLILGDTGAQQAELVAKGASKSQLARANALREEIDAYRQAIELARQRNDLAGREMDAEEQRLEVLNNAIRGQREANEQTALEVELIGASEAERKARLAMLELERAGLERNTAAWRQMYEQIKDAQEQLNKAGRVKSMIDASDLGQLRQAREDMLALAEAFRKGKISADEFRAAATERLNLKPVQDQFEDLKRTIEGWGRKSASAIADFVVDGKASFRDLFKSIAKEIIELALMQQLIKPWLQSVFPVSAGSVAARSPEPLALPRPASAKDAGSTTLVFAPTVHGGASRGDVEQAMVTAVKMAEARYVDNRRRGRG